MITTTGSLAAGSYTVAGTDSDTDGDTGNWTYTLTVLQSSPGGGGGGGGPGGGTSTIVQKSPTSGATTTPQSSSFSPGTIAVSNSHGAVTFVTTTASSGLAVSSSGVIATTASLPAGLYTVAGTDSDTQGDAGTWVYTLTVTDIISKVTFNANDGDGVMPSEHADQPSALSLNRFTRAKYTFVSWNTKANGSGHTYANGATYSFASSVTLFAQWKKGIVPVHTVVFLANGGGGAMATERHNTATALSNDSFSRANYTFVKWNTKANGSGASYANHATFPFTSSLTLFAQWKKNAAKPKPKPTFYVTFLANGGKGAMSAESGTAVKNLSPVGFTRAHYTFVKWNTKANGAGASYANSAKFSFSASLTLYAQWKHVKIIVPPAVDASVTIGTFAEKSSALTTSLESKISALANEVKANHDTKVALVGYGDKLSAADELNESAWAANYTLSESRASSVKAYLIERLNALGLAKVTVSSVGNGSSVPQGNAPSTTYYLVTAALS